MSMLEMMSEQRVREIVYEILNRERVLDDTWDRGEVEIPMPGALTFTQSGLNDGWSDQMHPLGGFWSHTIENYRESLKAVKGSHARKLEVHPYLNSAWIADFSPEREEYSRLRDKNAFMQAEVNLSHFSFLFRTIPKGGRRRPVPVTRLTTFFSAYEWDIRYNNQGGYQGADPGESSKDCFVLTESGITDTLLFEKIRAFSEDFLKNGPPPVFHDFKVPRG